ncbi:Putative major facilitator superfamily, MFS transporter superfamily [Septoria linicola]|uniref:Major facilitator superfamily, MFS transporter superfamily n=1 Tax=Septoria linicola TaxID=215465 RepID=A0A9Q9AM64_9PEZI|nr:Putative major facilitator superfamily, MFS transporter superfamily [Septoria linicola]
MGILQFINSFAKHDAADFEDVYVPLDQAPRRRSVGSNIGDRKGSLGTDSEKGIETPSSFDSGNQQARPVRLTLESLRAEIESELAAGGTQTAYDTKSKIINKAIQDIGMGPYQWQLFVLCGFGWFADNLWLQGIALTLPSLSAEFGIDSNMVRYTTLSLFLGLCIGASFWGVMSDIIGRRLAFNFTLLLAGIFGLAAGGAPTWIGTCALYACIGLGVGGNLPVDGALFLEFLPPSSNGLLTMLSVFWPIGQLVSSLIGWVFIVNYSDRWGWRYLVLTSGAITMFMFICRFFLFHLFESPKFLLSRGRQNEAVAVVRGIARYNKAKTWLSEDVLNAIGGHPDEVADMKLSNKEIIKRKFSSFSAERIGPLFRGPRLAISTVLIWFIWTTIGMGYPLFNAFLPQYLAQSGGGGETSENTTYRDYAITSVVGVPGSILACYLVNVKYLGRKNTMAIATVLSGIFLILFTQATSSGYQLAMSSLEAFFQNIMYGVLYAYTPEVFPAPNRGTGTGISSFVNRLAGLCAPIVAVNAGNADPKAPIYASAGLFFAAFLAMLVLPYETRGRQSL